MNRTGAVLAIVFVVLNGVAACSRAEPPPAPASLEARSASSSTAVLQAGAPLGGTPSGMQAAPSESSVTERKIVRSADLGIEAADPLAAERAAVTIVENLGGFVASTNRSQSIDSTPGNADDRATVVHMVLSVPSGRFMAAMAELEKLGSRVAEERIGSDDVTYEFIDVKAHLDAERALEQQFLAILKQASSVKDALEVHTHIAEVRTNIEKLEGRQRFLERQTSLSTVKLSISPNAPIVRAGRFAFGETFALAGADLLNVSASLLHGAIRMAGVVTPIAIFVVLPLVLFGRALVRRRRRALAGV